MKKKKRVLLIGGENPLIQSVKNALENEMEVIYVSDKGLYCSEQVQKTGELMTDCIDLLLVDLFTAAEFRNRSLEDLSEEEWEVYKYRTVKYMYDIGRYFIEKRLKSDLEILILTSIGGILPMRDNMLNCAGDASAVMFAQVLAEELAEDKVTVNCVAVGCNDGAVGVDVRKKDELLKHIPTHEILFCEKLGEQIAQIARSEKYGQSGTIIKLDDAFSVSYMREY